MAWSGQRSTGQKKPRAHARSPKATTDEDVKLKQAVAAVLASGLKPGSTHYILPISRAAEDFGVDRQKLARRLNGIQDRSSAHLKQQKLLASQEAILNGWLKALGHRSIPWTREIVREKAEAICGKPVGMNWVYRFGLRHPDIKTRWTVGLESCRAKALNKTTVDSFFKILAETVRKYTIRPANLYNMDEKGVQMGIGGRARVLVDRNQKTVYMKIDGNRELATLVECICADGSALDPLAILKGMRTNPRWGANNFINASIASSPNGWTDAELGTLWMEKIFEPMTRAKLKNPREYRLLILDGHNSHCTLKFLALAERFGIIILCLPPHTTHALQPCDVGVFGPLATHYRKEVARMSKKNIAIKKHNVIEVYGRARTLTFSKATIAAAFRKCGIWPLDPHVLPERIFAPALVTTSQAAQPLPASAPQFINAAPVVPNDASDAMDLDRDHSPDAVESDHPEPPSNMTQYLQMQQSGRAMPMACQAAVAAAQRQVQSPSQSTPEVSDNSPQQFSMQILDIPKPLPHRASRSDLISQLQQYRALLEQAQSQIAADHAQKVLMDDENGLLRAQLHQKTKDKDNSRALTTSARVLTYNENQLWNDILTHKERFALLHEELIISVTARAKRLDDEERARRKQEKAAEKEAERTRKEQEKETEKVKKATEKEAERIRKTVEREAERARKEREKDTEKARRAAEKDAEKVRKAAEKEVEKHKKDGKAKKSLPGDVRAKENNQHSSNLAPSSVGLLSTCNSSPTVDLARPKPRPRPAFRGVLAEKTASNESSTETYVAVNDHVIDPQLLESGDGSRSSSR